MSYQDVVPSNAEIVAKFTVTQIVKTEWTHGYNSTEITLEARGDFSLPEDKSFHEATPNGKLTMTVTNPAAVDKLKVGKVFYLAFIPAKGLSAFHT